MGSDRGPYVININRVDVNGKLDASYANPKPLAFHTAEVVRDGSRLKLLFELRAGGYGGSTYTLNYDAASDSLRGVYDQVVVKQKFGVVFQPYEVTGWVFRTQFHAEKWFPIGMKAAAS